MNQTVLQQTSQHSAAASLARLSQPHGYRIDGDRVHLHARFAVVDAAAHQRSWALQLWACPCSPASAKNVTGQIVAEVALPPMSEVADEIEHVDMNSFLIPPAGPTEHFMALVLAAGQAGQFDEVHDVAVYPEMQRFLQPRLRGTVGYRIDGNRVHLSAEHVENPRDNGNLSGTLALELWALGAPYSGGAFRGFHLAGVVLGPLPGKSELATASCDLAFCSPPAGVWHFVLMLREWTEAGYVTRDFSNFMAPVTYAPTEAASPVKTEVLVAVETSPVKPAAAPKALLAAASCDVGVKTVIEESPVPTKPKASKGGNLALTTLPPAKNSSEAARPVSINTAAEPELAAVEGLSTKLARSIIKKRPFASLDDLRRVKGLGTNLLARIRSRLRL